jgi:two-component system phosphate regulon response regulator PhoB
MGHLAFSRVLIVDDDRDLRGVIRLVLDRAGHHISEAASGQAALVQIAEARPHLMVVDMRMPGMTGAELISHVRADPATAAIPAVLLSGLDGVSAAGLGPTVVVQKPFEVEHLVGVVESLLAASAAHG